MNDKKYYLSAKLLHKSLMNTKVRLFFPDFTKLFVSRAVAQFTQHDIPRNVYAHH